MQTPNEPTEKKTPLDHLWISQDEWENRPERAAAKFGALAVVAYAAGPLATVIAIGAGLVVLGKLVRG